MAFIFTFHAYILHYLLNICGTGRIKFIPRLVNQLCIGDHFIFIDFYQKHLCQSIGFCSKRMGYLCLQVSQLSASFCHGYF